MKESLLDLFGTYQDHFILVPSTTGEFILAQNLGTDNGNVIYRYNGENVVTDKINLMKAVLSPDEFDMETTARPELRGNMFNASNMGMLRLEPIKLEVLGKVIDTGTTNLMQAFNNFHIYTNKVLGINRMESFRLIAGSYAQMRKMIAVTDEAIEEVNVKHGDVFSTHEFPVLTTAI